jgi:hypothetical protein
MSRNGYAPRSLEHSAIPLVRAIFVGLALIGLYLTYSGWITKPKDTARHE